MVLILLGGVALLILLILFHVRMHMEWRRLERIKDPKDASNPLLMFPNAMTEGQVKALRYRFSWSYAVTWAGVAASILAAIVIRYLTKDHWRYMRACVGLSLLS